MEVMTVMKKNDDPPPGLMEVDLDDEDNDIKIIKEVEESDEEELCK